MSAAAIEVARVAGMVLIAAALPLLLAAAALVSPWWLCAAPVWAVAQWLTRPGARWSVWRLD